MGLPQASVRSDVLRNEYQLRFRDSGPYRDGVWKVLCRQFFAQWIPEESHVLDVGAGWGEFINNIRAAKKYAIDLNPDTKKWLAEGATFFQQDCSDIWPIPERSVDVVFTSNFLEHLASKEQIDRTLARAYRCLRTNGIMICLGPNCRYLPGAYWDFWDHLVPITERSLAESLTMQGFQVETCISRFLPYSMSNGSRLPLFLLHLYLKMPIVWPIFGRQFFIVARKPSGDVLSLHAA